MFLLRKVENGRINVAEPEYYPAGSTAITQGEALVLSAGKLVVCDATATPKFISIAAASASAASVPVLPITPSMLFEADASASLASAVVGTKVTMTATGDKITATTTNGVATIVTVLADKKAIVRFE